MNGIQKNTGNGKKKYEELCKYFIEKYLKRHNNK